MCLAIYKPQGVQISKRYLRNGFEGNNDGAGFAYASKGTIVIRKGFFSFADFMQAYKPHQNKPCVIHFRMTTHGATNEKNCHPFALCGQKYALVHNGILDIEQSEDKGMSDTWHFAELILTPMLSVHSPDKPSFRYLVESTIGNGNKLVIMDAAGKATIYNEKAGEWHKGCWFSNSGYLFDRRSFWTSWDYSKKASKEASNKGRGYITLLNGKVQEGPKSGLSDYTSKSWKSAEDINSTDPWNEDSFENGFNYDERQRQKATALYLAEKREQEELIDAIRAELGETSDPSERAQLTADLMDLENEAYSG